MPYTEKQRRFFNANKDKNSDIAKLADEANELAKKKKRKEKKKK